MPILTLMFNNERLYEYDLKKGKSMTIGRSQENDIMIDNLAVSGHHAYIMSLGEQFIINDLDSRNGTFVNNKKITSHTLAKGDEITVGKHKLVFGFEEWEKPASATLDQGLGFATMEIDTREHKKSTAESVVSKKGRSKQAAVLSFLTKGEGNIAITKQLTKIGKSKDADVVIKGFSIGSTAATITRRDDGYYFTYVEGGAKPKINGKKVKDTIKLQKFDTIEIGSYKLQFISA